MNFFDKLQHLDRRYIYIVVALAIIIPFLIPFNQRTYTTEPVENIYQLIDSYAGTVNEEGEKEFQEKAILMVFSHDAGTMPELFPMEVSVLRHCFLRKVRVFTLCFTPVAAPLMDYAITTVKEEFPNIKSGEDYINFGYKPAALYMPIVLGMGDNISKAIETDAEGRNIENLDAMKNITNYNEMNFIIEFSASTAGGTWYTFARARFGAKVGAGITAVMAADQYPYIQTGQLVGILGGLKGAAEYEELVDIFANHKLEANGKNLIKDFDGNLVKVKKAQFMGPTDDKTFDEIGMCIYERKDGFHIKDEYGNLVNAEDARRVRDIGNNLVKVGDTDLVRNSDGYYITSLMKEKMDAGDEKKIGRFDRYVQVNEQTIPDSRRFSKEVVKDSKEAINITGESVLYKFKMARIGMNAQTVAHLMIILFIVLGNIGFFLQKRREKLGK